MSDFKNCYACAGAATTNVVRLVLEDVDTWAHTQPDATVEAKTPTIGLCENCFSTAKHRLRSALYESRMKALMGLLCNAADAS